MRRSRKFLAVLLAAVMLLSLAACGEGGGTTASGEPSGGKTSAEPSASPTKEDDGGFLGLGNLFGGEPEEKISWDLTDGVLTISGKGEMDDYSPMESLYPEWYDNREEITEILIEDGITRIGDCAFYELGSVTTVTIPASVTSIGLCAFESCNSLSAVTGGEGVTEVGASAFRDTPYTASDGLAILNGWLVGYSGTDSEIITIPDGVKIIGNKVFEENTSFRAVVIPEGVTHIGDFAFEDCRWLASVTMPSSVKSIGEWAFSYCISLEAIAIPDSVTKIGGSAFIRCESLSEVSGGKNVSEVGSNPFAGTPWLDAQTDTFVMLGSCLIDYTGSSTDITIPSGTTSIAARFPDDVRSIEIPASVTSLDVSFSQIESLSVIAVDGDNPAYCAVGGVLFNKEKTELICYPREKAGSSYEIPDSVTSIGEWAFAGCSSLTSITIPGSVSTIGDRAFSGCEALTTAVISDGITYISYSMFAECISLSSVTIPDSVTSIVAYAFDDCISLTDIYYGGSAEDWEKIDIGRGGNDAIRTNATIHYNAK